MLNANTSAQTTFNAPVSYGFTADYPGSDLRDIQTVLRDLESKGADGVVGLQQLARQVGNCLGTTVTPRISSDNQFSLVWTESDPGRYLF